MKKRSKRLGFVLMGIGGLMLLGMLGINIGWIIATIIPAFMTYKGWKWYSEGEKGFIKGIGIVFMIGGVLWLTGMLHVIVGLVIAAILIYQGFKLIQRHNLETFSEVTAIPVTSHYQSIDEIDEWEKKITK